MLASPPKKCPAIFPLKPIRLYEQPMSHDPAVMKVAAAICSSKFSVDFGPSSPYVSYYSSSTPATLNMGQMGRDASENANKDASQRVRDSGSRARGVTNLLDLPEEIQQIFLDMLVGNLKPTSPSATSSHGIKNWNSAMRHPRQKSLSNLALVTPLWRQMIQTRLYRHIKIQGTKQGLEACAEWFLENPHLGSYVRHIEFWVPVWEPRILQRADRPGRPCTPRTARQSGRLLLLTPTETPRIVQQSLEPINGAYRLSSQNSTLDELFSCVQCLFPLACILTIEGGHCKKPPMIQHFREGRGSLRLPELNNIRTLVLRGAWNIIREDSDFNTISNALPNMREWHCTFAKAKAKTYVMMYKVTQHLPSTLTHLNICLEGFFYKKSMAINKIREIQEEHHLCQALGRIIPQLVGLTLTGRICSSLFTAAMEASATARKTRLKSIDIIPKSCCRVVAPFGDSIQNWAFVQAFESLVVAATRSLKHFPEVDFLRIRYIDLDSPFALMSPYFQLRGNECAGIYSDTILSHLAVARPQVQFAGLGCSSPVPRFGDRSSEKLKAFHVSSYAAISDGSIW